MQSRKEELKSLISKNEIVDFAPFGNGISMALINQKEKELGVSLPDSYKWWVNNYAGGQIGPIKILSIEPQEGAPASDSDIVHTAKMNEKKHKILPTEKLFIVESGHLAAYFDTSSQPDRSSQQDGSSQQNSEYQVIEDWDEDTFVHKNFIEFLISYIGRFS